MTAPAYKSGGPPTPHADSGEGTGAGQSGSRQIGPKVIRRGLALNVTGTVLPAVAAVFCIRAIVAGLGHTRFGVLSLAWTFISAVGILDLGIGRALTRFLAVHEEPDAEREASIVWVSLATVFALGVCGGVAVWATADALGMRLAHGNGALQIETASALRVLSISVPLVVLSSGLRGVLEAFGRFDLTNRVSIPISLLNLAVPVVLIRFSAGLPAIVSALVLLRLAGTLLFMRSAFTVVPAMRVPRLSAAGLKSVLAFAGWVTVSNIPGPLFAQADRFLLGSFTTLAAVAFYSTPMDLLSRVTVVPAAVLQVMFPVFAQAVHSDRRRAALLAERGLLLIAAAVVPALTLMVALAPEALHLWLGAEFSSHATRPGRIAAVAIFINCMAWLPFSLLQSAGRADLPGKLHMLEIPVHLMATTFLIRLAGIDGAACATLLRATIDGAVIVWMASRLLGRDGRLARRYFAIVGMGVATMVVAAAPVSLALRLLFSVGSVALAGFAAWRILLDASARVALCSEVSGAWARVRNAGR